MGYKTILSGLATIMVTYLTMPGHICMALSATGIFSNCHNHYLISVYSFWGVESNMILEFRDFSLTFSGFPISLSILQYSLTFS